MPKIGEIVNGSVVKILKAGALIQISDKETGFLHISEISKGYVKNVNDYLKVGDAVTVRVMNVNPAEKRIYLSIRLIEDELYQNEKSKAESRTAPKPKVVKKKDLDPAAVFENKMSRFLKDSKEKQHTIQRNREKKQGVRKKPKPKK